MSNRKPSFGVKLAVDRLDDRSLPSITLYQHTDEWLSGVGQATVTTTVTDEGAGSTKWNYHLHNDSYLYTNSGGSSPPQGISVVSVHAPVGLVLGGSSSLGAPMTFGALGGGVSWIVNTDELDPGMVPNDSGDFWFFTVPERIVPGIGHGFTQDYVSQLDGPTAVPAEFLPTTGDLTPTVTWPDDSELPTSMTLTDVVTGSPYEHAPTGTVKFYDGGSLIGSVPLSGGSNGVSVATLTVSGPSIGDHPLTAVYVGDEVYKASPPAQADVEVAVDTDSSPTEEIEIGWGEPFDSDTGSSSPGDGGSSSVTNALAPPTGGNLGWNDYPVVPFGSKDYAAYTAGKTAMSMQFEVVNVSVSTADGVTRAEARAFIKSASFVVTFDRAKSYVQAGAQTPALLAHENLHLTLGENVALAAQINAVGLEGKGVATSPYKLVAMSEARKAAKADLEQKWVQYKLLYKQVLDAVSDAYDTATNHGRNPQQQTNWESNWWILYEPVIRGFGWRLWPE